MSRIDLARVRIHHHGLIDYPPGATFGPRVDTDFEFVWIERGNAEWITDGARYPVPQGTLLLSRPGMNVKYIWDRKRSTRHGFVHFALHDPKRVFGAPETWPLLMPTGGTVALSLLSHVLWLREVNETPHTHELADDALRHALAGFVRGQLGVLGTRAGEVTHPVLRRVQDLLRRHWAGKRLTPIELDVLAERAGVSVGHLIRIFTQELGLPPRRAILQVRLDRAATLLGRSNLSIGAVADECGFESQFHFSRRFKEHYGQPPSAFRQKAMKSTQLPPTSLSPDALRRFATELLSDGRFT